MRRCGWRGWGAGGASSAVPIENFPPHGGRERWMHKRHFLNGAERGVDGATVVDGPVFLALANGVARHRVRPRGGPELPEPPFELGLGEGANS